MRVLEIETPSGPAADSCDQLLVLFSAFCEAAPLPTEARPDLFMAATAEACKTKKKSFDEDSMFLPLLPQAEHFMTSGCA